MPKELLFKRFAALTLVGLFLVGLPLTVAAGSRQMEQSIYVGPDEIIDGNFIKAGNIIDINGSVNGDVIVAGNSIRISGAVAGDVIAAGNSITITGPVSGSVRVAGSTVQINGRVEHNVWAVGSTVALGSESSVGWDVYTAGGSVEVRGPLGGNLWVGAGTVVVASEIGKAVTASVDKEGTVVLYPTAVVKGNLTYRAASDQQLVVKEGATVSGETTRQPLPVSGQNAKHLLGAAYFFWKIVGLFGLLVIGLVLLALAPKKLLEINQEMVKRPWPSLGWGAVYFIVTPVVVVLLLVTLIGIPLALIILALYGISLCVSKVLAGFTLGMLLVTQTGKAAYKGSLVWPLALGLVAVTLLSMIPFLGWAIKFILVLWALGALVEVKKRTLKEFR